MIELKKIKPERKPSPPRIILYGTPKVGKTTFCANIQDSLFLDVEGGTGHLPVMRVEKDQLDSFDDVIKVLEAVLTQDHSIGTLVIDSVDFLEKVLQRQVAAEHGVSEYGKIGYGKGPVSLANIWRTITQKLDQIRQDKGIAIVMIAHETLKKVNDPATDQYDKYTLAMENKSVEHLEAWADIIMFAKEEIYTSKAKQGFVDKVKATRGERMLYTMDSPQYLAGNRYGLPAEILFTWEAFSEEMSKLT